MYDVVSTQGASTAAKVDSDLAVAQYVLAQAGGFSIDRSPKSPPVAWEAKNQLSGDVTPLALPRVLIGEEWLGKNSDVAVPTPVVDQIKAMTGATVTIFQKTPSGDFLRVATNVAGGLGVARHRHLHPGHEPGREGPTPSRPRSRRARPTAATPSSSTRGWSRPTPR